MEERVMIQTSTVVASEHHYYLFFPFEEYEDCIELTTLIASLTENDVLHLHINTPGGSLFNTVSVIQAIKNCQGTVIGHADGLVQSAGSIIFFSCHGMVVNEHCSFLLHDGSSMEAGKISDNLTSAAHVSEVIEGIYNDVYGTFFPEDVIEAVLAGQELYLTSTEVQQILEEAQQGDVDETDDEEELPDE